jgi:hypothetical protein
MTDDMTFDEYREAILARTSYDFKPGELRRYYDRGESIEDVIAAGDPLPDRALASEARWLRLGS